MRYLLDTHTFIWFSEKDNKLSKKAEVIIENANNTVFLSVVGLWEITIKAQLNKLTLNHSIDEITDKLKDNNIELLPIGLSCFSYLYKLPFLHKDPFDRMLIAQAKAENLTLITKDENIKKYTEIKTLW